MNTPDEQQHFKMPVDLVEALGATPLTYLVPTQNLAGLVQPTDFQVSLGDHLFSDAGAAEKLRRALTADGDHLNTYRAQIKQSLNIRQQFQNNNIAFNCPAISLKDQNSENARSIFDDLHGLAKELLEEITLVDSSKMMPTVKNILPSEKVQNNTVLPAQQKRELQPEIQNQNDNVTIKKRKSDIGVQHLQLENASLERFTQLIKNIGLYDEELEVESSDFWEEWNNTDHYLTDNTIEAMENCIVEIQGTSLVNEIKVEIYERIEQLAIKSVLGAQEMDWEPSDETNQTLKYANNALKASSLILTIFNSKIEGKKLYLDSYLIETMSFLYTFVSDFLIKSVLKEPNSASLIPYINIVCKIFKKFATYIPSNHINDTLITKLEYLTILIIFEPFDKDLLFFKFAACSLLLFIFESKENQRSFIIDEILINFDRLPTHKSSSRQVKLARGTSVQLITILLLNSIQCINLSCTTYANDLTMTHAEYSEGEQQARENEDSRFHSCIEDVKHKKHKIISNITATLVQKVINNPNTNTKQLVELFMQDLLTLVEYPEWPAAEALLGELTKTIIQISENQASNVESFLLELIGLVGSKMLELKGTLDICPVSFEETNTNNAAVYKYLATLTGSPQFSFCRDYYFTNWIEWIAPLTRPQGELQQAAHPSAPVVYAALLAGYYQNKPNNLLAQSETDTMTLEKHAVVTYRSQLLQSGFMKLYNEFLRHLLKSVDHPKTKSRTRALKNLASLIRKDPRLLRIPQIKQSLSSRINDSSPLVRLAVLEIFDHYISENPELISDFYRVIILTNDKSTSVRTKSIKIARKVFESKSLIDVKVFALEKILRRVEDDEESATELAVSTLMDILFLDNMKHSANEALFKDALIETAKIIISLINKSEGLWELFESFLFDEVVQKNWKNAKIHESLMAACERMTYYMFEFVIEFMDTGVQEEVEKGLGLLSMFSKSRTPLINQEQLLSLQAYLTTDSACTDTSYYSLVILRNTLAHTTSLRESFLNETQTSLLRKLTKFNSRELEEAVPIISVLSELKKDTAKVANAALSCLILIKPFVDKALKSDLEKVDPRNLRLIYLIGSFGKYCDFEKNRNLFDNSKHISLKSKESVLSMIVKIVMVFIKPHVNRQIRRVAVRNLIQICSTHAKLFMSQPILKVFDDEFKNDNVDFEEVIIQGLLEFLQKEDKNAVENSGHEEKKSAKVGLDVDVFHGNSKTFENDGICASLVQRYMEPILGLCLKEDGGISFLAVKYLRFIVKLGFANPRVCISTVIALQASPIQYIRSTGLELHKDLHERYESLIGSSYINGIKLGAAFRARVSPNMLVESHLFFQKFYDIIQESKSSKRKVLNQLVRSFNFNLSTIDIKKAKELQDYVLFLSLNLAEFEFESFDEIFLILEGVQSILSNQGIPLLKIVKEKIENSDLEANESNNRLAYLSSVTVVLQRLVDHFPRAYKILGNIDRTELKSQRPKNIDKPQFQITLYDPSQGSPAAIFQELCSLKI